MLILGLLFMAGRTSCPCKSFCSLVSIPAVARHATSSPHSVLARFRRFT